MNISLGCGRVERPGFLGLDLVNYGWNKVWDASKDQIPADDNSVDYIEAFNFVEHIRREYWPKLFNECWRVLKKGGVMEFTGPDASKDIKTALKDPTHVALMVPETFSAYFSGQRPRNADYGIKPWENIQITYHPKDTNVFIVKMSPHK